MTININGTELGDTITPTSGSDGVVFDPPSGGTPPIYVTANQGNDTVTGSDDDDTIYGGQDEDSLEGGDGEDQIFGDLGADVILGGAGGDSVNGNQGDDSIEGGDGNDTLYGGKQDDTIIGGDGNDILFGDRESDSLDGGEGDDTMYGGQQNDFLMASAGVDFMFGDRGNDTFIIEAATDIESGDEIDGDNDNFGNDGTDTISIVGDLGDENLVQLHEAFVTRVEIIEIGAGSTAVVSQSQIDNGILELTGLGFIQAAPGTPGGELDLSGIDVTVGVKNADGEIVREPIPPEPDTVTLTPEVDILTANRFNGPFVFKEGAPDVATLNPGDQLTGVGDNPTLIATMGSAGQIGLNPTLKGIETVEFLVVRNQTFNAQNSTGIKNVIVDNSNPNNLVPANFTITNLDLVPPEIPPEGEDTVAGNWAVTIQNGIPNIPSNTQIQFVDSLVAGADDTITLSLINNGAAPNSAACNNVGSVNLRGTSEGGFETLDIKASGVNNFYSIASDPTQTFGISSGNVVETMKIGGTGSLIIGGIEPVIKDVDVKITDYYHYVEGEGEGEGDGVYFVNITSVQDFEPFGVLENVTTVDATENEGGVDLVIDDSPNKAVTLTGGKGDDRFRMQTGLTSTDALDGGEGTDTVGVTVGFPAGTTSLDVKNFEVLEASDGTAAGSKFDIALLNGSTIETIVVKGTEGDVSFSNFQVGGTVKLTGTDGVSLPSPEEQAREQEPNVPEGALEDYQTADNINGMVTVEVAGAVGGLNDTINLEVGRLALCGPGDSDLSVTGGVTIPDIENINLTSQADSTSSGNAVNGLTGSNLVNLTITGSTDLDLGLVSDAKGVEKDGAADKLNVINASAFTGDLTLRTDDGNGPGNAAGSTDPRTGVLLNSGTGNDNLATGNLNDSITGNAGNDVINAMAGNDTIDGGIGNDDLIGDAGNDSILGGDGNDTLTGGAGLDTLTGGGGQDTFAFTGVNNVATNANTILGFQSGNSGDILTFDDALFAGIPDFKGALPDPAAPATIVTTGDAAVNANSVLVATETIIMGTGGGDKTSNARLAIATDTGAIFADANGNFTTDTIEIGVLQGGITGLINGNIDFV